MKQGEQIRHSYSLPEVLSDIERQAAEGNLAAVVIHLNDTYFIDARPPDIPGLARVSGLVHNIRERVRLLTGEDRTLLLHSGDYLAPSAMSMAFQGAPMVELLEHCGVDFATIGNHEFDHGSAVLRQHLTRSRLKPGRPCMTHVLANLEPPDGISMPSLVFWPDVDPFLAITGLAGDQTIKKATKGGGGFRNLDMDLVLANVIQQVEKQPGIGALLVLSHMDRQEDKVIQRILSERWDKYGYAIHSGRPRPRHPLV